MSADLLKRLAEAGTPMGLIMEVAETLADAKAAERLLERRRAKDRLRKRSSVDSAETMENAESAEIRNGVSLDKKEPQTPKKLNPSHVCETRAKGRWHRMPEGWSPTRLLPHPLQAKVDQWPPGAVGDELAAFRRWAANAEDKNGKGRKLDWDQAWRNWIGRRHDERYARTNTVGRNQPNDGLSSTTRASARVFGPC